MKKGYHSFTAQKICPCGNTIIIHSKTQLIRKIYCCKKCFYKYRPRPSGLVYNIKVINRAWYPKGNKPWSTGKSVSKMYGEKIRQASKGKHYSPETEFTSEQISGEKNFNWKGDEVGYYCLHTYMKRNYKWGKACEHCGSTKNLHLASRDYSYTRDPNAWIVLCNKCNIHYDIKNNMWGYATKRFNLLKH